MAEGERRVIAIVGGGYQQLGILRRARARGFRIVALARPEQLVGRHFADEVIDWPRGSSERFLRDLGARLRVHLVTSAASDEGLLVAGELAAIMGCPGPKPKLISALRDKVAFRHAQASWGARTPQWTSTRSTDALLESPDASWVRERDVVVKPVDGSGSRGVSRVSGKDSRATRYQRLRGAIEAAIRWSHGGLAVVETEIIGRHVSGESLWRGRELRKVWLTERKMTQGFRTAAHVFPATVSDDLGSSVASQLVLSVRGSIPSDMTDRMITFDAVCGADGVTVIEGAARLGGNGMSELIRLTTGLDPCDIELGYVPDAADLDARVPHTRARAVVMFTGHEPDLGGTNELRDDNWRCVGFWSELPRPREAVASRTVGIRFDCEAPAAGAQEGALIDTA